MANLTTTSSKSRQKSLGDPSASYESMIGLWEKARAILNGQTHTRAYDDIVDGLEFSNLLLPFSPSMSQQQYAFYRAEGELPGLVSQYAKVVLGGLLRKQPQMILPEDAPEEAEGWLRTQFGSDQSSMHTFLDEAIWEELQTSRSWVVVDHPRVDNPDMLTTEQLDEISPYAMVVKAENIINWRTAPNRVTGKQTLSSLVFRFYSEDYTNNEFHPDLVDTVMHYKLDEQGLFVVNTYQRKETNDTVGVINGALRSNYQTNGTSAQWELVDTAIPLMNGERISYIPAWPLNGQIEPVEPILQPLIDREIALYNKVSRRNHLLYGAATYTPVIMSDMTDDEFEAVVEAGLGSWIKLRAGDDVKALETPSSALADMEKAIAATIEEMARMGIRMLTPEGNSGDSGVALEIRNAGQTAQLGLLNNKISDVMKQVIACMLNWKYGTEYKSADIAFTLSADFNPTPVGADWMRLVTEWYQQGIIPRSTFVSIAKFNDVLPSDYDDEEGVAEIQTDPLIDNKATSIDSSISEVDPVKSNRKDDIDNDGQ